ncbi:prenyltransferase [Microbacterium soli]|uniref:Prenyltransferase n=1 Tax=Microbacterium soli TaxID=446075 RepID=A0ABP7NE76_9MICO
MTTGAVRQLLTVSRPVSWINTAFPFGAAYLMASGRVDVVLVIGVAYFLAPYNLALYGINDVFDSASDLLNPRKGGAEGAQPTPELHRALMWTIAASNIPFLVLLFTLGTPAARAWLAVSMVAVVAYSVPGLRLKERPVIDSLTSSTHFVGPALVGLSLAGAAPSAGWVLTLVAFFLWGAAAHAFGAVQDVLPDRAGGISSIATALGARSTVRLAVVVWITAGCVMLWAPWPGPWAAALVLPYIAIALPWWSVTDDRSPAANRSWRRFLILNYVVGFLATLLLIAAWRG